MLEIDVDARDRWLAEHAGDDPQLRGRVTQLLEAHSNNAIRTGGAIEEAAIQEPPERIGAYRLEGLIGSGGMGSVYAARRDRGDFEHEVAIKLIKPGLLSEQLTERFGRERQLLASFNHPNIARLYDGGETEDGLPFIVMEKVDGIPLAEWIEQTARGLPERLALFIKVCDAVGYAHGHLVVHRDLTPANILVEMPNQPKLIDFGIAHPDGAERHDTDGGAPLVLRHLTLTPGYAAPERLRGETATTLSDIYSAGRLLNFLVPKPRPPELQAIANRATSSDAAVRYQSIVDMAKDVRRYTEGRPVEAFSGGSLYPLRKWTGRNPALAVASALSLLAVVAGVAGTGWYARQEALARQQADKRLADTRALTDTLIFDVFDDISDTPGTTGARLTIARTAERHLDALASDPGASLAELFAAGRGYYRLAHATGTVHTSSGSDLISGIAFLERSKDILEKVHQQSDEEEVTLMLAETHIALARDKGLGFIDTEAALEHSRRAIELLDQIEIRSADTVTARARAYRYRADTLACCASEAEEGYRLIRSGLEYVDSSPAVIRRSPNVQSARNDLLNLQAGFEVFYGRRPRAIPIFRSALQAQSRLAESTGRVDDLALETTIALNLSRNLLRMGRAEEAIQVIAPIHRKTLAAYRQDSEDNNLKTKLAIIYLARAWAKAASGARTEARADLKSGMDFARVSSWPGGLQDVPSINFAIRLHEASEALWTLGDQEEACDTMRQSVAMFRDYGSRFELPETSLRYRIVGMEKRLKSCRS